MILIELDKSGAEWVIVAYLSGDANMLDVVERGISPHTKTGSLMSGATEELVDQESKIVGLNTEPNVIERLREQIPVLLDGGFWLPRNMSIRQAAKKSNHGLNYDMRYKRFALENEIQENEASDMVELYHKGYPGIRLWHQTIKSKLREDRILTNCFGRKRKFRDAWGPELFDAAFSFLPQSTTYDIIRLGMIKTYKDTSNLFRSVEMLAEVHDSFQFQYPVDPPAICEIITKIGLDYMNPTCVYNSKEFKVGTTAKIGYNWGNMVEVKLSEDHSITEQSVKEAIEKLKANGKKA